MKTKLLEIRDRATFIPVLAIHLTSQNEAEQYLLSSAGFWHDRLRQSNFIALWQLNDGDGQCTSDEHAWDTGARTMALAHEYIRSNWNEINTGDVIDVEFILNETRSMKMPHRYGGPT